MSKVPRRRQQRLQFSDDPPSKTEGNLDEDLAQEIARVIDSLPSGEDRTTVADTETGAGGESLSGTGADHRTAAGRSAFESLVEYFDSCDCRYQTNSDDQSISANFRGEAGTYLVVAQIEDEAKLLHVSGYASMRVPEGSRPAVAETVARANHRLRVGKFELDLEQGDLRFHASQVLTEDGLGDSVIYRLIDTTMSMLDMYLPAVLSVIYGNELPKDAIRCVEAERRGGEPMAAACGPATLT